MNCPGCGRAPALDARSCSGCGAIAEGFDARECVEAPAVLAEPA
jgi:hypothetical protein